MKNNKNIKFTNFRIFEGHFRMHCISLYYLASKPLLKCLINWRFFHCLRGGFPSILMNEYFQRQITVEFQLVHMRVVNRRDPLSCLSKFSISSVFDSIFSSLFSIFSIL